jgi:hypothetical protein
MYLFIHHEFLLFKNQKIGQKREERGDKVEKINVVDINSFQATEVKKNKRDES